MPENPYAIALDYFDHLSLAHHRKVMPLLLGSVGNHLVNQMNMKKKIIWKHGTLMDCRMHVFFVAPSRVSKSTFFRKFCEPETGLLAWKFDDPNKAIERTAMLGTFTEAGWIGTDKGAEKMEDNYGIAYFYSNSIVTFEEMSAILLGTALQEHSKTLIPQLLMTLDGGNVDKAIGKIHLKYHTDVTLWAGTQFARFDMTQGLAGRFSMVAWSPTQQEYTDIYNSYLIGRNISADRAVIEKYRKSVTDLKHKIDHELLGVDFGKFELRKYVPFARHWEQEIAEKMLLGIKVMKDDFKWVEGGFKVVLDPTDEELELLKEAWKMREQLMKYGPTMVLMSFLPCKRSDVFAQMIKTGYTARQTMDMITELIQSRQIMSTKNEEGEAWIDRVIN